MVGEIKGDSGASLSTTTRDVLMLGSRNIAAEIRGCYPAAGLCCAIHLKFKCGSTKATTPNLPSPNPVHILSDPNVGPLPPNPLR